MRGGPSSIRAAGLAAPRGRAVCAGAVLLLCAACSTWGGAASAPPDVVLVVVDALRADHAPPAAGGSHLAALAREARIYEEATAPATSCVPALASILTGRWPSFHGAERDPAAPQLGARPLDPAVPTLAELLARRGFATAAFSTATEPVLNATGGGRGFGEVVRLGREADGRDVARAAATWLVRQRSPSFALVYLTDLRRAGAPGVAAVSRSDLTRRWIGRGGMTAARRESLERGYERGLRVVDEAIGDLISRLRAGGRYEGALLAVTADHGELLGEHGLAGHGWPPYEPLAHVPLVVKEPEGAGAGQRIARRVSTLALFGTVLVRSGVPIPSGAQATWLGRLHPVWLEDVDRHGARVRAGYDGLRLKLVEIRGGPRPLACLFDLGSDPRELRGDCDVDPALPLRLALESFERRPRPAHARPVPPTRLAGRRLAR